MTDLNGHFIQWLDENYRKDKFIYLNGFYSDELELARRIFDCKQAWNAAKTFIEQLKPSFTCDADEAEEFISEGKKLCLESRDLEQAALLFSKAIYKAPIDSPQLARAHANRATVLRKLHYYEAAYEDCVCALQFNHPSVKTLLAKQAVIAWQLKNLRKMEESLKGFGTFNIEVPTQIQKFQEQLKTSHSPIHKTEEYPVSKFPKFNKIKLSKNKDRGRFFVAVDTIESGELISEDIASAFLPRYHDLEGKRSIFDKNDAVFICDNCGENDIVPFPCYECRSVFYCSKKCCQEHKTCHRYECKGYKISLFNYYFPCRFGYRCFLLNFDGLLRDIQNTEQCNVVHMAEELWSMILQTGKEGTLLGLHNDFENIQRFWSTVPHGMNSFLLALYLSDQTDFFEHTRAERLALMPSDNEWHVIIIGLILRFTSIFYTNAYHCESYVPRKPFTKRKVDQASLSATYTFGAEIDAIYCWASFFNHSCYSNAFPLFADSKILVYSRRRISKDEEVTIDYLDDSAFRNRDQRQWDLMQHHECHCELCSNKEDPIYANSMGIPCTCGGTCFLLEANPACKKCGNTCWQQDLLASIYSQQQLSCCPERYVYLYGICEILKKSLQDSGFCIFSKAANYVLEKYLRTTSEEVLGDEQINRFMIKLAVDLLQIAKNEYFSPLDRAVNAVMLLDLLSIRKARGFQELKFKHKDLIESAMLAIIGKPRKIVDTVFKLNCF